MTKKPSTKDVVIPCKRGKEITALIDTYAEELKQAGPTIGSHGLSSSEFDAAGVFRAAVEKLRGRQSASMGPKKAFLAEVLDHMKAAGTIVDWEFTGAGERHDYQVILNDGRTSIFEAKGCLDGNNSTIYQRPPGADEFVLWSLCQNAGSDPGHNAWSGIHTRIGANMMVQKEQVDGLIIWDMLCGTFARECPKLVKNPSRVVKLASGREVPPPCIYLFPRSIPDPRNNPNPKPRSLPEVGLLKALFDTFGCTEDELVSVEIDARMDGVNVQRQTSLIKGGEVVGQSRWTTLKRAVR